MRFGDRIAALRGARPVLAAAVAGFALLVWRDPASWPWCLAGLAMIAAAAAWSRTGRDASSDTGGSRDREAKLAQHPLGHFCDSLDHPVLVVDSRGLLLHANPPALDTFGALKTGEPLVWRLRHPEFIRQLDTAIAARKAVQGELEERVPTQRWLRFAVSPVEGRGERAAPLFLISFHDMTESRIAERQRTDFVANASHELRTPLASLRGFIETIRGPAAKDRKAVDKFLGVMLEQAERMSRLVDDLLSLSRIEMKTHLRPEMRVDLAKVLAEVADAMNPVARSLGVRIETRLPEAPAWVNGDRDELHQGFLNLVDNACKYGQAGKKVILSLEPVAEAGGQPAYEASVRDFGPGIAAEHLPRLTERFYRVDVAASREKQGTGLGLAIVKHILARHGTRLGIESEPGNGARFYVRFAAAFDEINPRAT